MRVPVPGYPYQGTLRGQHIKQPELASTGVVSPTNIPVVPQNTKSPNLPLTQSNVFPLLLEVGPGDAQGSYPRWTLVTMGKDKEAGTHCGGLQPTPVRGAHSLLSQTLHR